MSDPLDADTEDFSVHEVQRARDAIVARLPVRVEFGACSDVGKVRVTNQDHYLVTRIARTLDVLRTNLPDGEVPEHIEDFAFAMVVADGMGGMASGERASILAIRTGVKLVFESPHWALRIDPREARHLMDRMRQYFQKVDQTLIEQTRIEPSLAGMGTTLTVAYSVGIDVFIVHAGDSRAYHLHDGQLRQLTRDHTLAQELADAGRIPRREVRDHAKRHMLTNFAGGPPRGIAPEISSLEVANGDLLMLCTDGLTEMVNDEEIADVLRHHTDPDAAARALIDRALAHGGKDNVTVVLARYSIPWQTEPAGGRRPSSG
jgi:serine/threonine protein phosphatase PrpC